MPRVRRLSIFVGTTLFLLGSAAPAVLAQGRIIIEPPRPPRPRPGPGQTALILKSLNVYAEITDGVAVTTIEQSFRNPCRRQVEGVYIFPLPDNVAVGDFSMTVGGKTLHGEVLDADTARKTYEDIVRRMRDPGLLEYLGSRLFKARIFPIPPGGKVEVKLQYSQTLSEQGGLGLFRHPLRNESLSAQTVDQVTVSAKLKSTLPLTTVFSPSHECDVSRRSDYEATVSYEAVHTQPDRDFLLYYQREDSEFGLAVLTQRGAGEPGTFLLRISPRIELDADQILPKDIAFVIDTSGSMAGDKMEQAKRALKFCINSLAPRDRFNIYAFSTEIHPFRDQLVPADEDVKQAALEYTSDMKALGGTNINSALLAALEDDPGDDERLYLVVFMTDGQPTVGVTDPERILKNVKDSNTSQVRFHVLGVGSQVNTHLLDKLAEATRGARDYCTEKEDLELKLSAFVMRLAHPVLTDLRLYIDGVKAFDVYPRELPDLFRGNDLVVMGRYDGYGPASVRLEGLVLGDDKTVGYEGDFPKLDTSNDFLPRLWANRKVAYLLDQIRLHGSEKELVDEVVRLAKRYGIVTPYTSALILEEDTKLPGVWRHPRLAPPPPCTPRRRFEGSGGRGSTGAGASDTSPVGGAAVRQSLEFEREKKADALGDKDDVRNAEGERVLRHVGDKAFVLADGRWTDTSWDEKLEPKKITAFSDEYFELLAKQPGLKRYFALGPRVLVVFEQQVYETVPPSEDGE
ncbi:MAG: VWA domain-containing protein [Phycisphaerae bacterium]|nr:VWA domain-containing protein [Phycisphaerae bacterium]